jgi:hypothetical protein
MKTTDTGPDATRQLTTEDESPESLTAARLDSWKDIAKYLNRSVRTVQRWEMLEAMPVHRHRHTAGGSVYADRQEIDQWRAGRTQKKRSILRVSAIRQVPMESLAGAEQSALLSLLEVLVEQFRHEGARPTVTLPASDIFPGCAAKNDLVAAQSAPSLADRMTIGDTNGTSLLVACRRLKLDR